MKVLFVIDIKSVSNPFVITLCEGLKTRGIEVVCSLDEFWNPSTKYDIIHFHWPEAIYSWKRSVSDDRVERLRTRLEEIKQNQIKIAITCHNLKPHTITDENVIALYDMVYGNSDLFLHMGVYSLNVLKERYPHGKHCLLPHHLYDYIYKFNLNSLECKKILELETSKCNILCFGEFRTDEERMLVLNVRKRLNRSGYSFLVPGFYKKAIITKSLFEIPERLYYTLHYKSLGLKFKQKFISVEDTERYFCAADIVMIQRVSILNSGNLPMAFAAGKVVVGPNVGNVGDILIRTGNPTFNPIDKDSVVSAIKKAKILFEEGKGDENRKYAVRNWSTDVITRQLWDYYKQII